MRKLIEIVHFNEPFEAVEAFGNDVLLSNCFDALDKCFNQIVLIVIVILQLCVALVKLTTLLVDHKLLVWIIYWTVKIEKLFALLICATFDQIDN